ncbi:MAG TPA: hypothetical protein VI504_13210 [Candidatus Eisenbacteria bacterium]
MKRFYSVALASMAALAAIAAPASAATLRAPQAAISGTSLQTYFNGVGESINVTTDQLNIQRWKTTISGNSTMTLQISLAGNPRADAVGVYNANGPDSPPLYEVFPGSAPANWFAIASFRPATSQLIVSRFDQSGVLQAGPITYNGVNTSDFGYYIQGPNGTMYTQDSRQPGTNSTQAVVYAGTGDNFGCWWLCFEDSPLGGQGSDLSFDDAVLFLESVNPTPVSHTTWGSVKARFR